MQSFDEPPISQPTPLRPRWLGTVDYARAALLQRDAWTRVRAGADDELLLLEHPSTITMGRHASTADLLVSEASLAQRGTSLVRTDRGGRLTWHGPGQLVAYPIVNLKRRRLGVAALVRRVTCGAIDALAELGVVGVYDAERPGIWLARVADTELDEPLKVASVGLRIEGGVSRHGLAVNLRCDTEPFHWLRPCGLAPTNVTTLSAWLTDAPSPEAFSKRLSRCLADRL